jgi:hypothetical protein
VGSNGPMRVALPPSCGVSAIESIPRKSGASTPIYGPAGAAERPAVTSCCGAARTIPRQKYFLGYRTHTLAGRYVPLSHLHAPSPVRHKECAVRPHNQWMNTVMRLQRPAHLRTRCRVPNLHVPGTSSPENTRDPSAFTATDLTARAATP